MRVYYMTFSTGEGTSVYISKSADDIFEKAVEYADEHSREDNIDDNMAEVNEWSENTIKEIDIILDDESGEGTLLTIGSQKILT